jgi:hypothetical protein
MGAVLAALRESRLDADDVAGSNARNEGNTLKRREITIRVCDFDGIEIRNKGVAPAMSTGRMVKNKSRRKITWLAQVGKAALGDCAGGEG